MGRDCDISSDTFNLGFANRNQEIFVHDLGVHGELDAIHHLVFENNDWVIVSNGGFDQTTAVFNVPWAHHLQTGNLRVPRAEALGVLRADGCAHSVDAAEDDWALNVSS